jgi:uncharacterized protein with ATP-grasp and redox domains
MSNKPVRAALLAATWGNELDLSQFNAREHRKFYLDLLVDQSEELTERLSTDQAGQIHIVADNAGLELCSDLVLADAILQRRHGPVITHLKPWPMFVSDALVEDVIGSIRAFCACPSDGGVHALGNRLSSAMQDGHLLAITMITGVSLAI